GAPSAAGGCGAREGASRARARARARSRSRSLLRVLGQLLRRSDAVRRRPPRLREPRSSSDAPRAGVRLARRHHGTAVVSSPLVVTLDKRSAPRTIFYGDRLMDVDMPPGTRVVYPRPPLAPLKDPDAAIRY